MPKKAVIYARFSCNRQREAPIEDQLRVCREWCAREGYEVAAEHCDRAVSGRTDDRPEFQRMIANAGESENWGDFALAGTALCAECGRNLQGVSGRGRNNVKYEYYSCPGSCVRNIRREELEGSIASALRWLLGDRGEALQIANMVAERADTAEVRARRMQAEDSLRAAERGLRNILNAIEQGVIAPGVNGRIAELEEQQARARYDLEAITDERIDPERFADFLQCGTALDDATLLKAFVWQAVVSEDEILVTLNYDKKGEPARLDIRRVRAKLEWCPVCIDSRTEICAVGAVVLLRMPRAA